MTRTVVVAGVGLDRAWPALGSTFGKALRAWSRDALVQVVQNATVRDAEAMVVLGGLVSRTTAVPDTLAFAAAVLDSFPGAVHVAPGPFDWWGADGPYELYTWPANVHVWASPAFEPAPGLPGLWGSAWTSTSLHRVRAPHRSGAENDASARVLARAGLTEADIDGLRPSDLVLTVPDLVNEPGRPGGSFLVMDVADTAVWEDVTLPGQPGQVADVHVTGITTTNELFAVLSAQGEAGEPVVLRLSGELGPRVLLPGTGGPALATSKVVDSGGLTYSVEVPEPTDRSTRAEFLRAMAATRGNDRERHQTNALGLAALDASSGS